MKHHSAFILSSLAAVALAGINLEATPVYLTTTATSAVDRASNIVDPKNPTFSLCSCDLTPGGCDAECCCDRDCPGDTVEAWTLDDSCLNTNKYGATLPYTECIDRYNEPLLDDLRGGLYIYEKWYR